MRWKYWKVWTVFLPKLQSGSKWCKVQHTCRFELKHHQELESVCSSSIHQTHVAYLHDVLAHALICLRNTLPDSKRDYNGWRLDFGWTHMGAYEQHLHTNITCTTTTPKSQYHMHGAVLVARLHAHCWHFQDCKLNKNVWSRIHTSNCYIWANMGTGVFLVCFITLTYFFKHLHADALLMCLSQVAIKEASYYVPFQLLSPMFGGLNRIITQMFPDKQYI